MLDITANRQLSGFAARYINALSLISLHHKSGIVLQNTGLVIEVSCPGLYLSQLCEILPSLAGTERILCQVIGFKEDRTLIMSYKKAAGITFGCKVVALDMFAHTPVGKGYIGRVVDAFGIALDDQGAIEADTFMPIHREPINPLHRNAINDVFETGIKAIDTTLTLGKGQRMGLFAGSGVGKSTLLAAICHRSQSKQQINIIALVGERGREVHEFVHETLGSEGMKNSVVIAATAEQPPLIRAQAVYSAVAMAEYFSEQGFEVLLIVDSMTRFAMALREIGLAAGEPPTMRGYTSSVLSALPAIIERCGNFANRASITGIFSVLTEGDEQNDPVAETLKAILDGHIVLSSALAQREHYPAIDITRSVSRLFGRLSNVSQKAAVKSIRNVLVRYEENRTLLEMGLAENKDTQTLRKQYQSCCLFLQQVKDEHFTHSDSLALLATLLKECQHD
ncbi:FliI/YscN family ATPase [Rheinheimera aquimaris]|jgi:flagellum-specific ATP synthase|uniref:FliI/YscN family ATPase n=1 Tax=Rheinheimera aquimaris TaxID=412437 RepID=UPI0010654FEE|nr:FliI/YscN family ATPase [Rheinheimera aquimaris]|tara:strand:+ start:13338 stop:14693 length:1356 start_codon:yes stop_codon:yes gene_type:complete